MDTEAVLPLAERLAWLAVVERELFLFAAFWLVLGALDELAVDLVWLWLRLTGRARTHRAPNPAADLSGRIAVFIPAWDEADVLAVTIEQIGGAWPQPQVHMFVGVYCNDPATLAAPKAGAEHDPRVQIVMLDRLGPTTKADCLNALYRAMAVEEERRTEKFRAVVLQDAEDMVHPAGIAVIDEAIGTAAMVQLPVRPAIAASPRFVSGHYADEFAESHAKTLVVRNALGLDMPAAGVGCAIDRGLLGLLVAHNAAGPFAEDSLTEDYELGFRIRRIGGTSRFIRTRDARGRLVSTTSFFPDDIGAAARQKARWIHGIAFQGWDRLGWSGSLANRWMMLRDRRGPLAALVLAAAYILLAVEAVLVVSGVPHVGDISQQPLVRALAVLLVASLVWRAVWRGAFVAHEYGWREAGLSVLRIPVANVIGIMAGWRALGAYVAALCGAEIRWDKTAHHLHPALAEQPGQAE